jgi:hypothetical protein
MVFGGAGFILKDAGAEPLLKYMDLYTSTWKKQKAAGSGYGSFNFSTIATTDCLYNVQNAYGPKTDGQIYADGLQFMQYLDAGKTDQWMAYLGDSQATETIIKVTNNTIVSVVKQGDFPNRDGMINITTGGGYVLTGTPLPPPTDTPTDAAFKVNTVTYTFENAATIRAKISATVNPGAKNVDYDILFYDKDVTDKNFTFDVYPTAGGVVCNDSGHTSSIKVSTDPNFYLSYEGSAVVDAKIKLSLQLNGNATCVNVKNDEAIKIDNPAYSTGTMAGIEYAFVGDNIYPISQIFGALFGKGCSGNSCSRDTYKTHDVFVKTKSSTNTAIRYILEPLTSPEASNDGFVCSRAFISLEPDNQHGPIYGQYKEQPCPAASGLASWNVLVAGSLPAGLSPDAQPPVTVGGGGNAVQATLGLDCQWKWYNPITWFVCPLVDLAKEAVDQLDAQIRNQLHFDVGKYFDTSKCTPAPPNTPDPCIANATKRAWSAFRYLAYGLLSIIVLIMILSQATSFGPFDAYTIKKILPRLAIALITITLSWQILALVIGISNDIGSGIGSLIETPFKTALGNATIGQAGSLGLGAFAVGGLLALGMIGVASLAFTAMIAVIIAFFVLTFRNIVIILLVILAPVAIISWVMPATQKAWKFWSETLTSMLLAYPIIVAFISMGRVFSVISSRDGSIAGQFIAFIAYFGPYFALPTAFRLAGGAMAQLGGLANDKSRGIFDRQKKYRAGKTAENVGKLKSGSRFADRNPLARGFNRTSVGLGTGVKGRFGLGTRGNQAVDLARRSAVPDLMKSREFAGIQNNDDALMAATYDNAEAAQQALQRRQGWDAERARRAVAATQASIGFGRPQALAAAQQLVSTGTGYTGIQDMTETLARAAGGNSSTAASLAGFANSETKRTGRMDLAPGFSNLNDLVQRQAGLSGDSAPGEQDFANATRAAWQSADLSTIVRGKDGTQTQAFADHWLDRLQNGNQVERREAAVSLLELQNSLPYATGGNQRVINQTMHRMREAGGQRAGLNYNQMASMPVEDQLATIANTSRPADPSIDDPGAPVARDMNGNLLSGATIRGMARVHDQSGRDLNDPRSQTPTQTPPTPTP